MNSTRFILIITLFLVLSFIPHSVFSQTGGISGTVVDRSTGDPLPGANILVEGTNIGAAANISGEFSIQRAPAGIQTLIISYIGYKKIDDFQVEVIAGEVTEVTIELEWIGVELDEVVISVQARGQVDAINRQLASRTITNVVSADRIREIPDVNAAESIGRLPGVSIHRSGGEATKVSIRGLSPKYNAVTIGGVRMPATDAADRSVDLSMIASNMLEGIELTKALTPDQDADAIGGTVDLQLRRAPEGLQTDLSIQGGYNRLQETYGNYNISGSVSSRFFDNRLGAIVNFHLESVDRSVDTFDGSYQLFLQADQWVPRVDELRLRDNNQDRSRIGGSVLVDFRIPDGQIALNSFYSLRGNDQMVRSNIFLVENRMHDYDFAQNNNELSVMSNALSVEREFRWFNIDATGSYSRSHSLSPDNRFWKFRERENAFDDSELDRFDPYSLQVAALNNIERTDLYTASYVRHVSEERNRAFQANVEVPFTIGRNIDGYVQFGNKHTYKERRNDRNAWGSWGLSYGGTQPERNYLYENMPELGFEEGTRYLNMEPFLDDYSRDNFLDGEWPLGYTAYFDMLNKMLDLLIDGEFVERDAAGSFRDDYDGTERLNAAYTMAQFDIGEYIMFLPGFRYEKMRTEYTASRVLEARVPPRGDPGASLRDTTAVRENEFFLPMLHLRIMPTDWFDIRIARTNSLTRPDYLQFVPRRSVDSYQRYIYMGNPALKPAQSLNHDITFSVYTNRIGLFSVSLFHKRIEDLIWHTEFMALPNQWLIEDLDLEGTRGVPQVFTSLNNEHEATIQGFEIDFQTNFWYLPSPFNGIVINLNYTNLRSETKYTQYYTRQEMIEPPFPTTILADSTRTGRLPDQPDEIYNISLGFDYKGFSSRISFLYQADIMTWLSNRRESDQFTEDYFRIDASARQKLPYGLELYANFNNINNRADRNFQAAVGDNPTYIQYYGFTADIGVRFRF